MALPDILADQSAELSARVRALLADLRQEWEELERRVAALDGEFAAFAKSDARARHLASVPGIGPLIASALVAAVGDAVTFAKARDMAAWMGLVPRQSTTGGKPRLLGITRRGSKYLRKMLVHGARAALPSLVSVTITPPSCPLLGIGGFQPVRKAGGCGGRCDQA